MDSFAIRAADSAHPSFPIRFRDDARGNGTPAPGTADKPGPLQVPQSKLLSVLGYRSVEIARNTATVSDHSLQT